MISRRTLLAPSLTGQLIEVEASHRVEKQAKALQSELTFKDHQLTQAQKNHASAMKELGVERSKRKREREQAERAREEAAAISAKAAAAEATAAAAAAAAAAAESAAAALAAPAADDSDFAADNNRSTSANLPGSSRDQEKAPFPTLADMLLSDSSEDVMVLLRAASGGSLYPGRGGGKDGEANSSGSDGDETGFRMETPLAGKRRRDGDLGPSDPSSPFQGAAPDSASPAGAVTRFRGALRGGGGSGSGGGGSGGFDSGGARRRNGDVSGASPLPLAFTPSRQYPWERGMAATAAGGGDDAATARRGAPGYSASLRAVSGTPSTGKMSYANSATSPLSPGHFWDARRGQWRGGGGGGGGGGRLEELQDLSSQMFACAMALVEGEACAGDLLDVLAKFLETLPGETVRPGVMYTLPWAMIEELMWMFSRWQINCRRSCVWVDLGQSHCPSTRL